ncbi:hypothetical protein ILUMI_17675, partial [Ignelater luminosus]
GLRFIFAMYVFEHTATTLLYGNTRNMNAERILHFLAPSTVVCVEEKGSLEIPYSTSSCAINNALNLKVRACSTYTFTNVLFVTRDIKENTPYGDTYGTNAVNNPNNNVLCAIIVLTIRAIWRDTESNTF